MSVSRTLTREPENLSGKMFAQTMKGEFFWRK
jgi:hypothetical protein